MTTVNLLAFLLGGLAGLCMEELSICFINNRVSEPIKLRFSGSVGKSLAWIAVGAVSWLVVVLINGFNLITVEYILLISLCLVISAVDITIRKIPNILVFAAIFVGAVFIVLNNDYSGFRYNIISLFAGGAVFLLPTFFGKPVGMGDVKFAAAVGFRLGIFGFFVSIILMSILLVAQTVYLYATRKGTVKTKIALGPFLAFGFVSVMLLKALNNNYSFFGYVFDRLYLG